METGTFSKARLLCFCCSTESSGSFGLSWIGSALIAGCIDATQSCQLEFLVYFCEVTILWTSWPCLMAPQCSNEVVICNDCFIFSRASLSVVVTGIAWTLDCCHVVLWYSLLNGMTLTNECSEEGTVVAFWILTLALQLFLPAVRLVPRELHSLCANAPRCLYTLR